MTWVRLPSRSDSFLFSFVVLAHHHPFHTCHGVTVAIGNCTFNGLYSLLGLGEDIGRGVVTLVFSHTPFFAFWRLTRATFAFFPFDILVHPVFACLLRLSGPVLSDSSTPHLRFGVVLGLLVSRDVSWLSIKGRTPDWWNRTGADSELSLSHR